MSTCRQLRFRPLRRTRPGKHSVMLLRVRMFTHGTFRDAVRYLVDPEGAAESESDASAAPIAAAAKGFNVAQKAFDAVVGMDEPPAEMS